MNLDPVQISLREITETKHLLERLIISSESFDYFAARAALDQLQQKVRLLAKLQAALLDEQILPPDRLLRFPGQNES
jgi:hypothetical protein